MKYHFSDLILYEDNHLLVIYKPVNLLCQKDKSKDIDVTELAKDYLREKYQKLGNVYVGLVHRLDRMTEGILVLTKTSKAAKRLSEDIRLNNWHKEYLCLVKGLIKENSRLKDYLVKVEDSKKMKTVSPKDRAGVVAELEYFPIKTFKDKTLLKVHLITGRHHQIRVQMASFKHPLIGDSLYGENKQKQELMLACVKLSFNHPTLNKMMTFECLPKSKKWDEYMEYLKEEKEKI